MIGRQIEKLGKVHQHNSLWSSCKKFYATSPGVMEKWLRKDEQTDGRTCTQSGEYIYIYIYTHKHSSFGRLKSHMSYRNLLLRTQIKSV